MSLKRTFGLVGDYGSSSEDENDMVEERAEKKSKQPTSQDAQRIIDSVDKEEVEIENDREVPHPSSKWEGVRKEYEDSALMFKYIQDTEEEENTDKDKSSDAF